MTRFIRRYVACAFLLWAGLFMSAQGSQSSSHPLNQGQTTELTGYIHAAWQTLTRSQTDCKSLVDSKLATKPVLYVPADIQIPGAVQEVEAKCGNRIARLPRPIHHMGDVNVAEVDRKST